MEFKIVDKELDDPIIKLIEKYKGLIRLDNSKEIYKWELLERFKGRPDTKSENFLEEITEIEYTNLVYHNAIGVRNHILTEYPSEYRNALQKLFNEELSLDDRISDFQSDVLLLYRNMNDKHGHHHDERTISTFLTFKYPNKYTFYKNSIYKAYCELLNIKTEKKDKKFIHYLELINNLIENYIVKDDELLILKNNFITDDVFQDENHLILAQDILFQTLEAKVNEDESIKDTTSKHYWLYQPGEDAKYWENFLNENIIGLGWNELGDLSKYDSKQDIVQELQSIYDTDSSKKNDSTANWDFYNNMQIGDIVIVKKGKRKLLGYGEVISEYKYDTNRNDYSSIRKVKWLLTGEWELDFDLVTKTLTNITQYDSDISKGQKYYEYLLSIINNKPKMKENKIIDLLKYKKQIILQGPPGTGKTREAKKIAKSLIFENENSVQLKEYWLTKEVLLKYIYQGFKILDNEGKVILEIRNLRDNDIYFVKDKFIKGYRYYHSIQKDFSLEFNKKIKEGQGYVLSGDILVDYLLNKIRLDELEIKNLNNLEIDTSDQFKIIQFHASYTYEDFVRGIVSKPNEDGDGIVYEAENKVLATFAKKALDNYLASKNQNAKTPNKPVFEAFLEHIKEEIAQSELHKFNITDAVYLFSADETRFKYKGDNWVAHNKGLNMKFSELKKIIDSGATERQDIKKMSDLEELTRQHATYFIKLVEKFYHFEKSYKLEIPQTNDIPLKNFVLIIDEINRANLSSVLGELIYALEYRGDAVESMYEVGGENKLILPPNLYIIGTMNTADRSVGHIDYAIRRRFAFVDVLPKDLSNEEGIDFDSDLFHQVASLFDTNLSPEFEKKDVQLGHSYFIDKTAEGGAMHVRLDYEIKPILLEYVRDGVLIGEDIKQKIENLEVSN